MNREEIKTLKTQAGLKPYQQRLKDLSSAGSEYRASCPWHESSGDHNPSLAVFKSKEDGTWLFKCMAGCEKRHGDAISFVQQLESLTFAEAVRKIANDIGIAESAQPAAAVGKASEEQLKIARAYLAEHGVSLDTAKTHGMDAVNHPVLGLALSMPYDADPKVIKYRCVGEPKNKATKFLHAAGHPSDALLYNIRATDKELNTSFCSEVYVVESERDCLMMNSLGYMAVSVSSATACVDSEGKLKIEDECLEILARADEIFLTLDQDPAGQKCADAFETNPAFNSNQIKRIVWPYGGKRSKDPKDVGDLYKTNPQEFMDRMADLTREARMRPPKWRQAFRTIDEMDSAPVKQLITGFMTEGNIGLGGLSGSGKTFLALSIVKALTTGRPFVGHFPVPEIVPVLYLIPEVGDRQFVARAKMFGIPTDDDTIFLCRTLSQGATLPLDHPWIASAVKNMGNPVVVLDTAIRFSKAKDENSAKENLWMEQAMRQLREAGAVAVIALHHSTKKNANDKHFVPSLENTFRGTGDIGALLDIGYSIHRDKKAAGQQVIVACVKPRDFDPPDPFSLELRYMPEGSKGKLHSRILEDGDVRLVSNVITADGSNFSTAPECEEDGQDNNPKEDQFVQMVTDDPKTSWRTLKKALHLSQLDVSELAKSSGFKKHDGVWSATDSVSDDEPIARDFDYR